MTQRDVQDKPESGGIKPCSPANAVRRDKKPKIITPTYLHNAGLYYLQRFAASTTQFRKIMARKIDNSCRVHPEQDRAACLSMLDNLIETFSRSGLLNDEVYATGTIRTLRQRGLSAQAIMAKMNSKGIVGSMTRRILNEIDANTRGNPQLVAALKHARRRRIGPFAAEKSEPVDNQNRQRELASLARGGFDFEIARQALDMDRDEALKLIVSSD